MNLVLCAFFIAIIACLLTEPSVIAYTKSSIKKLFSFEKTQEDQTKDFLNGIDNTPLSHEEITQFRNFLTTIDDEKPTSS